jgi:WD40 repeat protein
LALSPNGKVIACGSGDNVQLWDLDSGKQLRTLPGKATVSLAFSPDGQVLVAGGDSRPPVPTRLWNLATGECRQLTGLPSRSDLIAYTPNGRYLVAASREARQIVLADGGTGSPVRTYQPPGLDTQVLALAPDGQTLAFTSQPASGSTPAVPHLLDLAAGRVLLKFMGHEQTMTALAFAPDSKTLASASDDWTVRLWDVATGREKNQFPTKPAHIQGLAIAPDGKLLAAVEVGSMIHLWDIATGRKFHRREGHEGYVSGVAFAPDGRTLATCSMSDQTIRLWDAATGKQLHVLRGHEAEVQGVAFLPDSATLLSGGGDGTVRLWDAAIGQERRRFTLHDPAKGETKQRVLMMKVSTDGRRLVVSGACFDGRSRVQSLVAGTLLRANAFSGVRRPRPFTTIP